MNKSKSSLFLMELILAILIFAIAGAVCIQIFVRAHLVSENTQILNQSVTICESAAELFYGYDGDLSRIQTQIDSQGLSEVSLGSLSIYYDENFMICDKNSATYVLNITEKQSDNLINCSIIMNLISDSSETYSLSCSLFTGGKNNG